MPVPDYQSLMAPVLGALADGGDHSLAELRTVLAERLSLTEEDLQAKIASGTPLFANRSHGLFGRAVDGAQRAERLAERLRPRGGPM